MKVGWKLLRPFERFGLGGTINHEVSAQCLLGFRERAINHDPGTIGCELDGLALGIWAQSSRMQKLALRLEIGGELLELTKDCGVIGLSRLRKLGISTYNHQHVLHSFLL